MCGKSITASPTRSMPPTDRFRLTPDAIDELDWFVSRSGQMLADTLITFQRMEAGLELVYGLDFEIIFARSVDIQTETEIETHYWILARAM